MKKINLILNKYFFSERVFVISSLLLLFLLFVYLFFRIEDLFLAPNYLGDENKYLNDLVNAEKNGIDQTIAKGTSLPFFFLTLIINYFFSSPLTSIRTASLISGGLIIFISFQFLKKDLSNYSYRKYYAALIVSYFLIVQATFLTGVNDVLLGLFGLTLMLHTTKTIKGLSSRVWLIGLGLAMLLLTRKMALTYLFVFYITYVIFWFSTSGKSPFFNFNNLIIISFSSIAVFLLFNAYSLYYFGTLTFDDKILPSTLSWAQWEYHSAILIDQGKLNRFQHVDMHETVDYLHLHGKNSLPTSFFDMIFFDLELTIKEFFIDFITSIKYLFRQLGIILFAYFYFLFGSFKKLIGNKTISGPDFWFIFSIIYLLFISFIVITNIQPRWFTMFLPFLLILTTKKILNYPSIQQRRFFIINNIILLTMNLPYIFGKFLN